MGRAIVREPQVFLMDEPLSNLDAKLRVQTRTQIAALQRRLGTTTVYVTHDQVEAMTMGDRVAVLKDGILQQVDSPRALYDSPANAFVATFIGSPSMNLITARITEGGAEFGGTVIPVAREVLAQAEGDHVIIGVRPEDLHLTESGAEMKVTLVEELGADTFVYGTTPDGVNDMVARSRGFESPRIGEIAHITPERTYVFNATGTQQRIF
jgi:multiple sugar transport system ATP-binding protein